MFETYFTLEAEESTKRNVLHELVLISQRAAPRQGLESLSGALMRRAAETIDSDAMFFLSLVPPTVRVIGVLTSRTVLPSGEVRSPETATQEFHIVVITFECRNGTSRCLYCITNRDAIASRSHE